MSLSEALTTTASDTVSEFTRIHAKALQATASEGIVQGPFVVAIVGLEVVTCDPPDRIHTTPPLIHHAPHICIRASMHASMHSPMHASMHASMHAYTHASMHP